MKADFDNYHDYFILGILQRNLTTGYQCVRQHICLLLQRRMLYFVLKEWVAGFPETLVAIN